MANHITNLVTVTIDDPRAFIARHITTDAKGRAQFDFETIVPMPRCVKDTIRDVFDASKMVDDGQVKEYAKALLEYRSLFMLPRPAWAPPSVQRVGEFIEWMDRSSPNVAMWARRSLLCAGMTGYPTWYEWSYACWGTKWSSYQYEQRSVEASRLVFAFQTANGVPRPIFAKLAEMYPLARFDVESIDEGGWEYEATYEGGVEVRFGESPKSDDRYLRVYGRKRPVYDDDGEEVEQGDVSTGASS